MDITTLTHTVNPTEVDAIFNDDEDGVFTDAVIVARTKLGSTYQISLTGPTVTIISDDGPVRVRRAQYVLTIVGREDYKALERYVGFSRPEAPQFTFFSLDEGKDTERTLTNIPLLSQLLRPDMKVIFLL